MTYDREYPRPFTVERLENLFEMREEWPDRKGQTFWRHDVDFSVEAAWTMAVFEKDRGISATYFLMPDNPFYTPRDALLLSALLTNAGHRVGLHVDTRRTPIDDIAAVVQADVPVSFHCPRSYELWKDHGFEHAYSPEWEGHYYADSRGVFAYGDPEDSHESRLQINLHPEWWFQPDWADGVDEVAYEDFFYEPKKDLPAR